MAKSFPWSTTVPSGSEQAMTADDHFRRLRLELGERIGDFVVDFAADPVVLKPDALGKVTGKTMLIHSSQFVVEPGEDATFEYGESGVTISNNANPTRAPLILPIGVTLNRIEWLVTNGDSAQLVVKIGAISFAVGAANSTVNIMNTTVTGAQIVDSQVSAPFTRTINGNEMLYLSIDKGSGAEFVLHGVRVTYDTPVVGATL